MVIAGAGGLNRHGCERAVERQDAQRLVRLTHQLRAARIARALEVVAVDGPVAVIVDPVVADFQYRVGHSGQRQVHGAFRSAGEGLHNQVVGAGLQARHDEIATERLGVGIHAVADIGITQVKWADLGAQLQDLHAGLGAIEPQSHGLPEIQPIDTTMPIALATEGGEGSGGAGQVHVQRLAGADVDIAKVAVRQALRGLAVNRAGASGIIAVGETVAVIIDPVVANLDTAAGPG